MEALAASGSSRPPRAVIYVKSGVYHEKVEIGNKLRNLMFVGDGIDKTIVTGNRNVVDGSTTVSSSTFGKTSKKYLSTYVNFKGNFSYTLDM